MGRLYVKEMIGDSTIGYFQNGNVTKGDSSKLMSDSSVVLKYRDGHIYSEWMGSLLSNQIAYCDQYGNIYAGNGGGAVLAKCENGVVYDSGGYGKREIARYEGDMYGAAAAVAALILHLGDNGKSTDSNSSNAQNDSSGNSNDSSSENSGGCVSAIIGILTSILLFVPLLLWCFLPLVLCIWLFIGVILDGGIDFTNDADALIIFIPIILSGICNICVNLNSKRNKISKKQSNLCRLIMNAGTILGLITYVMCRNSYETPSGLVSAADAETTPLGIFFGVISVIIFCLTPVVTYIFLRKCKK